MGIKEHVEKWKDCQLCPLGRQRFRICLGRGAIPCDVLFIGQSPGASEDASGLVFDGPAGGLLDEIIRRSLPTSVTHALTNIVCCFPREAKLQGTEEPEVAEILACRPRLVEFVNIARPKLIVCVGSLAEQYVDHGDSVKCVDIVHPAAILRREVPRVKKGMMVQHTVVIIRNALESVLQSDRHEYTDWGTRYADSQPQTTKNRLRADYDDWRRDSEISF